jgi:hypothetical protein
MCKSLCIHQCELHRPSSAEATAHSLVLHSKLATPSSQRTNLTANFDCSRARSIVGLLFLRRPAAIFWAVVPIVIDAINRMFKRWARTHVAIEVFERISPTIANGYSTTPVSRKLAALRVVASLLHCSPNVVFSRFKHSVDFVFWTASATFLATSKQHILASLKNFSAVALTNPFNAPARRGQADNYKPAEHAANQVSCDQPSSDILAFSHDVTSKLGCELVRAGSRLRDCSARFILSAV